MYNNNSHIFFPCLAQFTCKRCGFCFYSLYFMRSCIIDEFWWWSVWKDCKGKPGAFGLKSLELPHQQGPKRSPFLGTLSLQRTLRCSWNVQVCLQGIFFLCLLTGLGQRGKHPFFPNSKINSLRFSVLLTLHCFS